MKAKEGACGARHNQMTNQSERKGNNGIGRREGIR